MTKLTNFTTLTVNSEQTSVCGCIRPGSCSICTNDRSLFYIEKAQLIKEEEDFNEVMEEVDHEF